MGYWACLLLVDVWGATAAIFRYESKDSGVSHRQVGIVHASGRVDVQSEQKNENTHLKSLFRQRDSLLGTSLPGPNDSAHVKLQEMYEQMRNRPTELTGAYKRPAYAWKEWNAGENCGTTNTRPCHAGDEFAHQFLTCTYDSKKIEGKGGPNQ